MVDKGKGKQPPHLEDIMIVNCLPHEVYLATPSGLVPLPRINSPELLARPADAGQATALVPGDERIKVSLDTYDGLIVFGSSNVPKIQKNTVYLVSLATLNQFPDRQDFAIANTWPIPETPEPGQTSVHVLVGYTRRPFEVVGFRGLDDASEFFMPDGDDYE